MEGQLIDTVSDYCSYYKVDSKNVSRGALDLVIEIKSDNADELVDVLAELEGVKRVALVSHDGEVKG
ncbi:MAG: hypothetical protein HUJ70_14480 [Pseudobutyrivibrio sp.]|nr:hypothetical protein [Pseudobutyrivibrio sp.]MCF0186098.1 hypothetical protein [Bacteroidaceae bacterium]